VAKFLPNQIRRGGESNSPGLLFYLWQYVKRGGKGKCIGYWVTRGKRWGSGKIIGSLVMKGKEIGRLLGDNKGER